MLTPAVKEYMAARGHEICIQALDMLGRKLGMKKGTVFMNFLSEVQKTVNRARQVEQTKELALKVQEAANHLGEIALNLGKKAMSAEFKAAGFLLFASGQEPVTRSQ